MPLSAKDLMEIKVALEKELEYVPSDPERKTEIKKTLEAIDRILAERR